MRIELVSAMAVSLLKQSLQGLGWRHRQDIHLDEWLCSTYVRDKGALDIGRSLTVQPFLRLSPLHSPLRKF